MYRLALILISFCIAFQGHSQLKRYAFTKQKMGAPFNLVMYCSDSLQASRYAEQSFALVDSLVLVFSDYDSTSELSGLNRRAGSGPQKVSMHMLKLLLQSEKAWKQSKGAFDITLGPVIKLWRKARRVKMIPDSLSLYNAMQLTGFQKLMIDSITQSVTLAVPGMQLDMGGIAQGYIAQEVINMLRQQGIRHALADASGDVVVGEAPPGSSGWTVGVNIPETTDDLMPGKLLLRSMAVTTSGDVYQFVVYNGKKYSHIVDPRTGYGITSQRNVTVIAADGATADWLATTCSVLPVRQAKKLARRMHASLQIGVLENEKISYYRTGDFKTYWIRNKNK